MTTTGTLAGKGILVTGGTRGIGRSTVLAAIAEGARVVFCGRDRAAADEVLRAAGGRAWFVPADVALEAEVEALFDRALELLPSLDGVVNNAGIARDALLVNTSLADWNQVLAVNLRGPFLVCRRAVDEMLAAGAGGRIVNVASFAAGGLAGASSYAASKSALLAMTRSIAKEVGRKRIAVNAVVPGFIETDMIASFDADARARLAALAPDRRLGSPDDVASTIVFLLSDDAAFVTGDAVYVTGGVRDAPRHGVK